jgi:sugar transferase (PEP-CTERM system associated)
MEVKKMFRVFRRGASASALMEVAMDGVLGFVAVLLAAVTIDMIPHATLMSVLADHDVMLTAVGFAMLMALLHSFLGLYRHTGIGPVSVLWRLALAIVVGGYLTYLVLKQVAADGHPARLVTYAVVYLLVALLLVRGIVSLLRRLFGEPRVIIVGTGAEALEVARDLGAGGRGHRRIVGFYPTASDTAPAVLDGDTLDGRETLADLVRKHGVSEIVVAVREQRGGGLPMDQLLTCRTQGVPILDLAGFYERTRAEVPIDSLKASWLVYGSGFVQGPLRRFAKRSFDIVSSGVLLVLGAPVMLLAALAIKLDSPGPVLYRQERVGLGGRRFMCVKFRSMRTDAERDGVARWATKNDSRVTRVGAFLRKTRIDELPQLLSVLSGEMSMVGPRPERPSFVAQLREQIPFYDLRHSIKPGLTGWAQVRYSYGASLDDARRKHQFDLYYVKNNSLFLDLLVLIETVTVVLFREGAQ